MTFHDSLMLAGASRNSGDFTNDAGAPRAVFDQGEKGSLQFLEKEDEVESIKKRRKRPFENP